MEAVTPAQTEGLVAILSSVLSPDNDIRSKQEKELLALRTTHPNEFVLGLLSCLQRVPSPSIRSLSSILLRQSWVLGADMSVWPSLHEEVKVQAKSTLLLAISCELDKGVQRRISDALSALGATVLTQEGSWPELFPFLFQLLSCTSDPSIVATGLHILACLFSVVHEMFLPYKARLYELLSSLLGAQTWEVQLGALEAVSALLSIANLQKEIPEFTQLQQAVLLAGFAVIEKTGGEQGRAALESLIGIAEAEARFFEKNLNFVVEFMERISALEIHCGVKSLALEFVTSVAERRWKRMEKNSDLCRRVLEKIFLLMLSISKEVGSQWMMPPEGYSEPENESEDEIEIDYAKIGRNFIRRLLLSIGDELLLPMILSAIRTLISDPQDWRKKYVALLSLSQLGNFITEPQKIAGLMPILTLHYDSVQNAKIRYAVFLCIEKLCAELEDEFKEPHHIQIAAMIEKGIADNVPRVVAQAAKALEAFFQNCTNQIASTYSERFSPKLIALLATSTPSYIIESALPVFSRLCEALGGQFAEVFTQMLPHLFMMIRTRTQPQYKQLRGKAINCLIVLCTKIGQEVFFPHVIPVINLLSEVQSEQFSPGDPQMKYLMAAWQTLCTTLKQDFSPFLPSIIPGLLELSAITPSVSVSSNPLSELPLEGMLKHPSNPKISVSTSDTEVKSISLSTLHTVIETMKGTYMPYVEKTIQLALPLVSFTVNEEIRSLAANILGALLTTVIESGREDSQKQAAALSKVFLSVIHPAVMSEFDPSTMVAQLRAIKEIVQVPRYVHLAAGEVEHLGQEMIKLLQQSMTKHKCLCREAQPAEGEEEDDVETDEISREEEDQLLTAVSEVFGALFRTHTESSISIVRFLCDNVFRNFLNPFAHSEDHKFAIFVIDDIIEFIGPALVPEQWPMLSETILRFAASPSDALRQAACYGLGILATKTEKSLFAQWSQGVLEALVSAINKPVSKSAKSHGHARDNAVAALGRVLRHQSVDVSQWFPFWVKQLPIHFDKVEARAMHEQLAAYLNEDLSSFLVPDGRFFPLLPHVVQVFGEVLETKLISEATKPLMKAFFLQLRRSNLNGLDSLWSSLLDTHRRRILRLLEL